MKATIMKNTPLSAFNNFEDISLPSGINSITRRILKMPWPIVIYFGSYMLNS